MKRLYCYIVHYWIPMAIIGRSRLYVVSIWNRGRTKTCDTCETTFDFSD